MPFRDKENDKLYYGIGEVARKYNVNVSLIRFWEKKFDIIKPRKNKNGNRLFTQTDLNNFDKIFHLVKERGYTLEGAKEKLKENPEETAADLDIVKTLTMVKRFLLDVKKNLQ
jgi:DNA-binding transcriptional MerR regulator